MENTSEMMAKSAEMLAAVMLLSDFDICQRLEIEYLWIDSLCILQDDEADWKDQASKMVGIYQNSISTIAATKSSEPLGGIYS